MLEVLVDKFDRTDWERFARNFTDYNIYQTWAYQQMRAEMDNQELSRAIIKDNKGNVTMICQVRIKHIKPLGLRVGYVQWGPLFRGKDGRIVCSYEGLQQLREVYLGNIVDVLRVVPNACNDQDGQTFADMLQSAGFARLRSVRPYRTLMLRVDDSEEEIRKRLHKSFRRDLKMAEKTGIEMRESVDYEFCEILEKLYLTSRKKKGFAGRDPEEFIGPQRMLSPAEKMNISIAFLNDEPISAHLASNLGDTAVVLLAGSNEKGLEFGSSYLVWYRAAVSAWRAGMKWYDLGGIDPSDNPNVYQFKSRMGAEEVFHIGAFEAYSSSRLRIVWHICEKTYNLVKKRF
jgi:phosphoribosylformylglycinamidine (FGAM) synthase PurS component